MFVDWLLASFHHLAVFSLAGILSAEIFLTAGPIDDRMVLRVARIDAWFGLFAAIVVAAGVLRVFFGAKGYEYYSVNIFFWAKMALFVGVGLVSVAPTMLYIGWRRRVRADPSFRPPADEIAQLRQALYVEAGLFASFRFARRRWRAATGCDIWRAWLASCFWTEAAGRRRLGQ